MEDFNDDDIDEKVTQVKNTQIQQINPSFMMNDNNIRMNNNNTKNNSNNINNNMINGKFNKNNFLLKIIQKK